MAIKINVYIKSDKNLKRISRDVLDIKGYETLVKKGGQYMHNIWQVTSFE